MILSIFTLSSCGCNHADEDKDHLCDECGESLSECADANSDHKCDDCQKTLSEHKDENADHKCDTCQATVSECKDETSDHKCDTCGATVSECKDADTNGKCDTCGKNICTHTDANTDHACDVCNDPISECTDAGLDHVCDYCGGTVGTHTEGEGSHRCGYCGEVLSECKDADGNNVCDVCGAVYENVSYVLNISDIATGTRSDDDINGKFTIVSGTEVRSRPKTFEGVAYTKSVKLGSSSAAILVDVSGNGTLTMLVQNGSSGATTQKIVLVAPDGTENVIEFAGNNEGNPVVKVSLDVTPGVWTVKRSSGTVDVFRLQLDCIVPAGEECDFELVATGNTNFLLNAELDLSGLRLNAVFDSGKTEPLPLENVTIDTSAVDMTKAGTYTVKVNYKDYPFVAFTVNVYEPSELKLGFDATVQNSSNSAGNSVYFNNSFKEVYAIGDELSLAGLSVTIIASNGNKELSFLETGYTVTGFDSATAGAKTLTVAYEYEAGKTVSATVTVYVVDTAPSVVEGVYMTKVDKSYTGTVGAVVDGYNTFNTIQQALDFLAKISEPSAKKLIEIGAGKYTEKIEITIPRLTIKGAGRDLTVIEWNSLYGVPDASGYVQVTDSTASVAIRDTAVDCTIEDITISNYWNSIDVFNADLGANYSEHRALALLVQADRFILKNSNLIGYQDTVEFFLGRQYVENCYIAGTTDFIFGTNNTTLFYNCEIHSISNGGSNGGYITAFKGLNKSSADAVTYGAIFYQCHFTADSDVLANQNTAIGRPWGDHAAVAVINCELDGHISKTPSSGASRNERYVSMSGVLATAATVQFLEYGNTGAGALTEAIAGMRMLTETEAALYSDISVIFGKTNGKVSYLDAWDPKSGETPEDDRSYYYFNGESSPTGTSNTFDTATSIPTGETITWGDLVISAENGKVAWTQNANALNMKKGAYIKLNVKAGTEVTVTAYPNYQFFTINGVGTSAATMVKYFAEDTEVVILSTGDCYILSIFINPGEEAPETADLTEIKVEGMNTNYKVGDELTLEGVTVKAYYSDNTFVAVDGYEIDQSAVNAGAAGSYDVVFTYGGKTATVTVTFEDSDAAPEITTNTTLDFTTTDGYAAVESNPRVTLDGSFRFNGAEHQVQGTISFPVKAGTVIKVIPYANPQYASYTIGKAGESGLTTYNDITTYIATEDCTVVYTGLSNNYLKKIEIICPVEGGKYVFGGAGVEGDVTGILASTNNIVISGTCKTHSGGAQLSSDSEITFTVGAYATVTIKGYDTNYGILEVYAGVHRISIDANACYVFTTTEPTVVTIKAANVGSDEAPAYNKSYITYIEVAYEKLAEIYESTQITFGSEGNYKDSGIDFSGANVRDNGGNNTQISSGSFSFLLKAGATLTINGYPNYTSYTITDGKNEVTVTDVTYTYTAAEDVRITITAASSNNYLYSFSVAYPVVVVPESFTVTFGTEGNYKDAPAAIDLTNVTIGDNGGNNSQVKNGTITITLKAGAVLTINGYPGYTSYTIADGTTSVTVTDSEYTYTATADVTVTITPEGGNNYFYSIVVAY